MINREEFVALLGREVPEWQARFAQRLFVLMDDCKDDEEVRLVPHPRLHQWMLRIVLKDGAST